MQTKFQLGDVLKDVVTGYEGVVLAITHYYTGCVHYCLQSRKLDKDGKERTWESYDESRLVIAGKAVQLPGRREPPIPERREILARSGPFPAVAKP